jgi:hypothetical protein
MLEVRLIEPFGRFGEGPAEFRGAAGRRVSVIRAFDEGALRELIICQFRLAKPPRKRIRIGLGAPRQIDNLSK